MFQNYCSDYLMDREDSVSMGEAFLVAYCLINKNEAKSLLSYYGV
jgi:hypothetical protein